MSDISSQRRIAAEIMKCGVNRVYINPDEIDKVGLALTRSDVSELIKKGFIKQRKIQGTSRRKARANKFKRQRGQRTGIGSRKGTAKARTDPKETWMNKIRAQRKYLKELRDEGYITPINYRLLYRQAKGNLFRNVRYLSNYIQDRDLAEKKIPEFKRR
jgi:large subunit ribosomal protein L19e